MKRRYHRLVYRFLLFVFVRSYKLHLWAWYKLLKNFWKGGEKQRHVV